jgi:hypothetical protein
MYYRDLLSNVHCSHEQLVDSKEKVTESSGKTMIP